MIFTGILSAVFFLGSMLQEANISYLPLYILLMITLVYYTGKYLHEWYHYFSITVPAKPAASRPYTVDVLTTYCAGEPFEMLEETLTAIQRISYPHTAWCCDEADDPMVRALCERLGVQHVTRTNKKDAKAGNINNALQFATGEICVVLDPDHIPVPGFIEEIIGYFEDPSIGFVQIVQAYYNQADSLVARGAAQQTYQFYGPVMMSMHSYGTVQAIGANCTFRRAALDSIGGHASGLAEDMHTAMRLHAGGWKSVYIPAILTRGLVPSTMSSYYKQQLKWSRGTWELFVTAFPKLFSKFTWQQKLHYFTLPFHYLSGLVFLINFLIPVISLFTGYIPLQMDVYNFLLASLPMICMGLFIRHYVQKWVVEETDRGFHLVGGILQIGTWWIHSVGFVYTLLRKKVPYIPTPKNDKDPLPFALMIPNLLVAVISIAAIVYGFMTDYTPYTIFMAGLAFMQVVFMVFIFSISGYVHDDSKLNNFATRLKKRNGFIILAHGFLRKYSVPLSIVTVVLFFIGFWQQQQMPDYFPKSLPDLAIFYRGASISDTGKTASDYTAAVKPVVSANKLAIVALDIPWGEGEKNELDTARISGIFQTGALPLVVWKPRQKDSAGSFFKGAQVMQQIIKGNYDEPIISFARQLAALRRPVFLRLGDAVADSRPILFTPSACSPQEYIAAWQHMHSLFDNAGAGNIIWIWNPWTPAAVLDFFPGKNYVDWLGINLNCDSLLPAQKSLHSFDTLYRPYHQASLLAGKGGMPVMLTQIKAPGNNGTAWWSEVWKTIDTGFTEIKSVIIAGSAGGTALAPVLAGAPFTGIPFGTANELPYPSAAATSLKQRKLPFAMKAVVYDKGYYWFRNRHTLTVRTIDADLKAMKQMGINTIERKMPGFYDDNLGKAILANQMNLVPSFWLMATPQIIASDERMKAQRELILTEIKNNRARTDIVAWKMADDLLYVLSNQSFKPGYFYYRQKYIEWLSDLCKQIRQLDSTRPIIMDLHWDAGGMNRYQYYKEYIPQVDYYMLEADPAYKEGLQMPLEEKMAWGRIPVSIWPMVDAAKQAATIPAWQDMENTNFVSLNGILDLEGRKKEEYAMVQQTWGHQPTESSAIPEIRILRPLLLTSKGSRLDYQLLCKNKSGQWKRFADEKPTVRIEWYLVRTDQFKNTMFIKKAGEGPVLSLIIPEDPQYYQLFAEAVLGNEVKMVKASLNTPLE